MMVLTIPALAASWRDELKPIPPGKFPLPRPQTAIYRFGWGAVSAAEASLEFSHPVEGELQLKVNAKTIGTVRALWQMDAQHTARCTTATLRPISFQQKETYRHLVRNIKADFTPKEVVRILETDPPSKKPKPKRFKFPELVDFHTALLLIRSQPLEVGERHALVVYPDRDAYLARVEVVAHESIKVAGKNYKAVKAQVSLQQVTKKRELEPHKRFKHAYVWVSDDKDRLLLKIQSEVFVGSVWMELQSVKFANE
jgi:hypothetical protein